MTVAVVWTYWLAVPVFAAVVLAVVGIVVAYERKVAALEQALRRYQEVERK
jgi:hypothetical protein